MHDYIDIKGAKVHNLKNVSVKIPKNQLVVITGVSGSGKSSLAFDTIYAEGQRRYVESLSSYARQFLGLMEKPDVEHITGLSPAISIDQKTSSSNPRSTVGTVTEIYDYLRLLYTQVGEVFCPNCGKPINAQTIDEIFHQLISNLKAELKANPGKQVKIQIIAPIIQAKKGTYQELFDQLLSKGFMRVIVDGTLYNLEDASQIKLSRYKKHDIDLVVDRLVSDTPETLEEANEGFMELRKRIIDALELSTGMSDGEVKISINDKEEFFSENYTCLNCHISFPKVKPATFSFNSPHGACPRCSGLGTLKEIDVEKIYNPRLSILEGGIFPWSNRTTTDSRTLKRLEAVAEAHGFNLKTPIGQYDKEVFDLIFFGTGAKPTYRIDYYNQKGQMRQYDTSYEGVVTSLERHYKETNSNYIRQEIEKYMVEKECSECHGQRLKPFSLSIRVNSLNIHELTSLHIGNVVTFLNNLELKGVKKEIAMPIIKEISTRCNFLINVGLDYLTLARQAKTLSGGESQRIRLASQIGTGLTGVLYVLDEPSIGLHSRDVSRLINTLHELRDLGNSVIVVEHDFDTIREADYILDIGPAAGVHGGNVTGMGTYKDFSKQDTLTAKYLRKELEVGRSLSNEENSQISFKNGKDMSIEIDSVKTNNLKNVSAKFPLGKFISVTGVSGSGKSSLINDTLYPILMNEKMNGKQTVGEYGSIQGLEYVTKVIGIDQSPIGRTPRSNPITYTGGFDEIRNLFSNTPEARARGYKQGRFSFNVRGGRCEKCRGDGQVRIEMQFLADMYVTCEACGGTRYNKDTLQIDYKGLNIAQVLDLTVNEAQKFFENIPAIKRKLDLLDEVGLGYIKLGQYATTLSGGESQRIKLAKELSKSVRGHTVYILDEPTTGLHFHDVDKLLMVLKRLVAQQNTVIVIEHNMDIIRFSDWIIDLGPDGGEKGGEIIAEGTVEEIIKNKRSYTGQFLKEYLKQFEK